MGQIMKAHDNAVYESVEKLRKLGREWREPTSDGKELQEMVEEVKKLDSKHLLGVSRGFAHFLALSNAAGTKHLAHNLTRK